MGQLGDGTTTNRRIPTLVVTGTNSMHNYTPIMVTADGSTPQGSQPHSCILGQNGATFRVFCWGDNTYGALGNNTTTATPQTSPVQIDTGLINASHTPIQSVAAGGRHTCLIAAGVTYCWGRDVSGQLGVGNTGTLNVPRPRLVVQDAGALGGKSVTNLAAGAFRTCVSAGGRVFCWGLGANGQIGDGTQQNRARPTESVFLRPKNNEYVY